MKKIQMIIMLGFLLGVCTGCTNYAKEYSKNTLVVKPSGTLIEIAIENYKDTKVKAEDLVAYVDKQVEDYNKESGKGHVKKKQLLTEDMSNVKLVLRYKSIDDYNGFNALTCSLKNYSEVEDDVLSGSFTDADGKSVKKSKFKDVEKAKVLVISEPTDIVLKGDILYYNKEVTVKKGIITASGKKDAVIIYK